MQSNEVTPRKRTKSPEAALQSLMRLCSRAEKSTSDARRLMRGWGVEADEAECIIQRLEKDRFIDDNRYAEAFVREKLRLSGWGPYKIRQALQRKEIAREVIDELLGAVDRTTHGDRLEEQLRRKVKHIKAATAYERRTKLMRYGLSLGYDFETVGDVVTRLMGEIEE